MEVYGKAPWSGLGLRQLPQKGGFDGDLKEEKKLVQGAGGESGFWAEGLAYI